MLLFISYNELKAYVKEHYNVAPCIEQIDIHTMQISYSLMKFFPEVKMQFHVVNVAKDSVLLAYDGSAGSKMLINGIFGFLQENLDKKGFEIDTQQCTVLFYLDHIDYVKDMCKFIVLDDISFETDGIHVSFRLK